MQLQARSEVRHQISPNKESQETDSVKASGSKWGNITDIQMLRGLRNRWHIWKKGLSMKRRSLYRPTLVWAMPMPWPVAAGNSLIMCIKLLIRGYLKRRSWQICLDLRSCCGKFRGDLLKSCDHCHKATVCVYIY